MGFGISNETVIITNPLPINFMHRVIQSYIEENYENPQFLIEILPYIQTSSLNTDR